MPLNLEELLQPIAGDNPSGQDLRYDPVYERIKEARREDDEAPQGQWERARKTAEWPLVVTLTTDTLTSKSKDLQIAAWLTEALLNREGLGGLRSGLDLIHRLLDKFWDTLYPQLEDGDAELRAGPLSWIGLKMDVNVKRVPLVRAGHGFFKYIEAQNVVGYETATKDDPKKVEARKKLIEQEGKLSGEAWDKAFEETPKAFYKQLVADLDGSAKLLDALDGLGDKFGDAAPSYRPLRTAIEEVRALTFRFLQTKLALDPDPLEPEPAASFEESAAGDVAAAPLTAEPVSWDDAVHRVIAAARFLRQKEPTNPASYLLLRGLRWGEVRASKGNLEPRLLHAPTTALRSQLKLLLLDGKWDALLEACEGAMGQPCGRGWLDLQRYAILACGRLGADYRAVEAALRDALGDFLAEVPGIATITMMDDTPTANAETQQWIAEDLKARRRDFPEADREGAALDGNQIDALQIARAGRAEEAVALSKSQVERERTSRGRFRRRTQLAAILVEVGQHAIARPILEELVKQIETNKLEEWESGEMVAEPLAFLYRVLHKLNVEPPVRQALYLRICRLDPMQALKCPQ